MRIIVKYILVTFFIIILKTISVFSQTENQPCCNGIISTDPRLDPNGIPYSENQGRSAMINKFNWMTNPIYVYHPTGGYTFEGGAYPAFNPFFSHVVYLSHINFYNHDEPYTADKIIFWPEEGWELLHKGNGFQLNEIDYLTHEENRKSPYFILYNKYSSVLRFFGSIPIGLPGIQKIKTEIEFWHPLSNPVSALLSKQTNISQPLDQKTKIFKIAASSDAPTMGGFWTSDFYMAYDPCICHNKSKLYFSAATFQVAELDLTGRVIAIDLPLDGSGNSPLLRGRDYLTSVFADNYNGANAGILTFNSIDSLVKEYKKADLSFWEDAGLDALKELIKGGAGKGLDKLLNSALGGPYNKLLEDSGIAGTLGITAKQGLGLSIFAGFADNINLAIYEKPKIPNIGFIEGEMALTGTYTNQAPINDETFDFKLAVPGSKDTENSNETTWKEYPAYNEALGVFALLETPKVRRYIQADGFYPSPDDHLLSWYCDKIYYKLDEQLKYYFNPAADIDLEKTKISVALLMDIYNPVNLHNLHNFAEMESINSGTRLISPLFPIGCSPKAVASLRGCSIFLEGLGSYTVDSAYIRILITYVTNPNKYGKINEGILEFTYPVQIIDSEEMLIDDLADVGFIMNLETTHFTENQVIEAWNNVYIEGDLTTEPGVNVVIKSGTEIIIKSGSTISPNITLTIGLPDMCEPVPPVSDSYVKNFCTIGNYKANQLDLKVKEKLERQKAKEYDEFIEKNKNAFNIFPNPASTDIELKYIISPNNASFTKIYVHNFLGQTVLELISQEHHPIGEFSIPVDVSGLSPGVYYCTMQSPLGVITKSFVVIK